jgi:GTP cyclohydrolase I
MNAAAPKAKVVSVEDVQNRADTRQIPINKVGIRDINHPVKVKDRSSGEQHTVANFNMYVNLPHNFKGTHMSRFVEILHREREISVESFGASPRAKHRASCTASSSVPTKECALIERDKDAGIPT